MIMIDNIHSNPVRIERSSGRIILEPTEEILITNIIKLCIAFKGIVHFTGKISAVYLTIKKQLNTFIGLSPAYVVSLLRFWVWKFWSSHGEDQDLVPVMEHLFQI
ncbi:hypothetical protein C5167_010186 [Papaver somniferum]|uniref:Uncharacterized protein n=1 Tax=Papaver somniferum TaxID=3469 RepID=A0A4Y7JZI6_PAPSO|nr:hypothetical protein C5167_010186 [Papaver somniferum]